MRTMTGFPAWAVDGFVVFALVYLAGSLELVEPFQRYLVPETLPKYSYPFLASSNVSVPTWTLPFLGVFLPLGIIASVAAFTGSSWLEIRRACAGLCVSVSLGWAITNLLKVSIGGYRPDFLYRCWPDGNVAWASPGVPACVPTNPRDVLEGRKSFPSGHSSMSFSGLGFAALYATAKLGVFSPYDYSMSGTHPKDRATMLRIVCAWWPLALATWVAVSRWRDYWHHSEDVICGSALGLLTSYVAWMVKQPLAGTRGGTRREGRDYEGREYAPMGPDGGEGSADEDGVTRMIRRPSSSMSLSDSARMDRMEGR